jgi:hypothetical protein
MTSVSNGSSKPRRHLPHHIRKAAGGSIHSLRETDICVPTEQLVSGRGNTPKKLHVLGRSRALPNVYLTSRQQAGHWNVQILKVGAK